MTYTNWKELEGKRKICSSLKKLLSDKLPKDDTHIGSKRILKDRSEGHSKKHPCQADIYVLGSEPSTATIAEKCGVVTFKQSRKTQQIYNIINT